MPPAFDTAATTSRQWVNARIGTSMPNISVIAVFMRHLLRLLRFGVPGRGRRPGEGLGDLHPLARRGAGGDEGGVVDVAALRDDEAEVERRPGDRCGRGVTAPGPHLARRVR